MWLEAETKRLTIAFGILAAVGALYWPTLVALGEVWSDGARTTYTHGYLIAVIAVWLMWSRRGWIARPETISLSTGERVALLLLLLAVATCWQLAYRAGLQLAVEMLLLPLLWLPVLLLMGRNVARATWLPVAFMIFALPLWDAFTPFLQYASVQGSRLLLRLVGIPAFFHGNSVEIPAGVFQIEGGCSGLHYFVVSLAVATLIGELRNDRWQLRLRWLLLAVVLAGVVNWFRIASIIYIGHISQMQNYLVKESHYFYGWALFAFALLVLFLIERRTPLAPVVASTVSPEVDHPVRVPLAAQAACVLIIVLPAIANIIINARLEGAPFDSSLLVGSGWQESAGVGSDWRPIQNNADSEWRQRYQRDGIAVEGYVAQYSEQRLGKKLGGFANRPQGDAEVLEAGALVSNPETGYLVTEQNGRRSMLLLTYRVADRAFASATRAQLWYSWVTLRTLHSPLSKVVAWRAACDQDCDRTRELLRQVFAESGNSS
jgi:exosortase